MNTKRTKTHHTTDEPVKVRRALAETYRKLADGRRFTPAERAEFARMADSWASTLPEKKSIH